MKKGAAVFIVSLLMLFNLKPIAHALNATQAKSRFALFCMVQKDGKTSCPHEKCPIMNSDSKAKEKSCDTRIGCETTHHQEASASFVNGSDVYIQNTSYIDGCWRSSSFILQPIAHSLKPLALSIDKPPQNIA